jgi:hypothetical protein
MRVADTAKEKWQELVSLIHEELLHKGFRSVGIVIYVSKSWHDIIYGDSDVCICKISTWGVNISYMHYIYA